MQTQCLSYIDTWLTYQTNLNLQTHGYSVCIMQGGEVLYNKCFGFNNAESKEKLTDQHYFRIASHSKTFTAFAVFQLAEAGKICISDPISKHLSFLRDNPHPQVNKITIGDLLSHQSGVWRDGYDASFWRLLKSFSDQSTLIDFFKSEDVILEPRSRFKYSNYAYGLLGLLIEDVTSESYHDYIRTHILAPLGLDDKIFTEIKQMPESLRPFLAKGYTAFGPDNVQSMIKTDSDTNALAPATGLIANAPALCRFL